MAQGSNKQINTKTLPTALGILQQGRTFRFKWRKWQDLFRALTSSSQNLITARMRIIFIRELFTFQRKGPWWVLQQIRCLSKTLVCPHYVFLTATYHVNKVERVLFENQRCFKAVSAMGPMKVPPPLNPRSLPSGTPKATVLYTLSQKTAEMGTDYSSANPKLWQNNSSIQILAVLFNKINT